MSTSQTPTDGLARVRTRIAPSPTGDDLHIGNLYTAYFNWAFARKHGGDFIVRIEDTDRSRLIPGSEEKILSTLKNYKLIYDEGVDVGGEYAPYRQSERLDIYTKYTQELIDKGEAYYCFCSEDRLVQLREKMKAEKKVPKYDKHCLSLKPDEASARVAAGEQYVIRMNIQPGKTVSFTDLIRGEITFLTDDIDDQVLLKSDGFPTYHLAVVVDDHVMNISHVIRAEEWISSTPKHVLLYQMFGWDLPVFAHVPILRNPDKSKLSKRKNPVWATWYLDEGYLPEAMLNYLSLMGWSHPDGEEIFSSEDFVKLFDLVDVKPTGPVFDLTKLEWMNGEYIRAMSPEALVKLLVEFCEKYLNGVYSTELIATVVPLVQERIKTLKEFDEYCRFFVEAPVAIITQEDAHILHVAEGALKEIPEDLWKADEIGNALQEAAKKNEMPFGKFFMALRTAISGKKITPPLNESLEILGKAEVLGRLQRL